MNKGQTALVHRARELDARKYLKGLQEAVKTLEVAGIQYLNSDARRPVHAARAMGCEDTRDLLNAPRNQADPWVGLVCRGRTLTAQLARHALEVERFLAREESARRGTFAADTVQADIRAMEMAHEYSGREVD